MLKIGISIKYRIANSTDPDEMAHMSAISSGSTLFAKVSVLVYRTDTIKLQADLLQAH